MDAATGFWVYWLAAALVLYVGLVWAMVRFGAREDASEQKAAGAEGPGGVVAGAAESRTNEQGGKSQ